MSSAEENKATVRRYVEDPLAEGRRGNVAVTDDFLTNHHLPPLRRQDRRRPLQLRPAWCAAAAWCDPTAGPGWRVVPR
jgi:hypothetical protein